jgi:hypothetical protein
VLLSELITKGLQAVLLSLHTQRMQCDAKPPCRAPHLVALTNAKGIWGSFPQYYQDLLMTKPVRVLMLVVPAAALATVTMLQLGTVPVFAGAVAGALALPLVLALAWLATRRKLADLAALAAEELEDVSATYGQGRASAFLVAELDGQMVRWAGQGVGEPVRYAWNL